MTDLNLIKSKIAAIPTVIPMHTDQGHFYNVPSLGKTFGSVTKELQALKDPSLTNWKMNRALDYIKQHFNEITPSNIDQKIFEAKELPVTEFQDAGSIGTTVHETRQRYFSQWLSSGQQPGNILDFITDPIAGPEVIASLRGFEKFVKEQNYQPVACEILVFDEKLGLAGTLDDIGIMGDKWDLTLMDLKTSNQLKPHYWLQVALYATMFYRLTHIRIKKFLILNTSKKNDHYELEYIKNMPEIGRIARHVLATNRGMDRINELRKPERMVI
jgi:hypothetical protein